MYLVRTGCQWRLLPHDFPPWSTVHTWYRRWRTDGTWDRINEALRQQVRSAANSQSVKTTPQGGAHGFDNGKKVKGRTRHLWVDSLGLLLAVVVTAPGIRAGQFGGVGLRPGRHPSRLALSLSLARTGAVRRVKRAEFYWSSRS